MNALWQRQMRSGEFRKRVLQEGLRKLFETPNELWLGTRGSTGYRMVARDVTNAKIVLVEAATNSFADLFAAVDVATNQVLANGGRGEVSMSWGGSEFSSEVSDDSHFQHDGVVYFASSGDTGGANIYPSVSPFVVSAGGTSVNRDSSGNFVSETGWSGRGAVPANMSQSQPTSLALRELMRPSGRRRTFPLMRTPTQAFLSMTAHRARG